MCITLLALRAIPTSPKGEENSKEGEIHLKWVCRRSTVRRLKGITKESAVLQTDDVQDEAVDEKAVMAQFRLYFLYSSTRTSEECIPVSKVPYCSHSSPSWALRSFDTIFLTVGACSEFSHLIKDVLAFNIRSQYSKPTDWRVRGCAV